MRPRSPAWLLLLIGSGCGQNADAPAATSPTRQSARCTVERSVEEFSYSEGNPPTPEFFVERDELRRTGTQVTRVIYLQGPDQRWLTADDEIRQYQRSVRTGSLLEFFTVEAPGPDGQWLTTDDVPRSHEFFCDRTGPGGRALGSLDVRAVGPDGKPCTDDDEVSGATAFQYDAAGALLNEIFYDAPGADGRWLTADDVVSSWLQIEWEKDGAPHRSKLAHEPGPDGAWMTADDPLRVYATYTYKGNDEADVHMGDGGVYLYCKRPTF